MLIPELTIVKGLTWRENYKMPEQTGSSEVQELRAPVSTLVGAMQRREENIRSLRVQLEGLIRAREKVLKLQIEKQEADELRSSTRKLRLEIRPWRNGMVHYLLVPVSIPKDDV
ncbi:hypothetical protein ACMD2_26645 [Ananas comosus]|uniref:Uncharacterized protein n=1 Tax=Ananas comosus TaxID=4615 RepID=A0A199UY23_ANACO|nr:hypothetical protein ACMD2_26645 [Ananas comosus]